MPRALITSRSFGAIVSTGVDLLRDAGFEAMRVVEEDRPLDEASLLRVVRRDRPNVIISGAEPLTEAVISAATDLRMIMKHGVGIDNIDLDAATSRQILVANAPGTNTQAVAELTVALIFALLRRIVPAAIGTRAGRFERHVGREIRGLNVGIVGTGRIGAAVARLLQPFGASLLGYDPLRNDALAAEVGLRYVPLEELLRQSDFVSLHVPLTPDTIGLIGPRQLEWMKPSAFLINAARGELVDEAALADALSSGVIAGAAVDVFATEPPVGSPLLPLENVIATPHIAAYTVEAMERMDRVCAETILAALSGGRPANLLNPHVLDQDPPRGDACP